MNSHTTVPAPIRTFSSARTLVAFLAVAISVSGCQAISHLSVAAQQPPVANTGVDDISQGILPDGVTAFDEEFPGIGNLDPTLRQVLQQATRDAQADNVEIVVNSGWRSPELQTRLLDEAIAEYGSREEAARWVATAETSAHVAGNAVDVGEMDAYLWLSDSDRGSAYGLCQTYVNEPWHFEYIPEAISGGCPEQYLDPTHDPRMQT